MAADNGNLKALGERKADRPERDMDLTPNQLIYWRKLDARQPMCLGCPVTTS